MTEATDCVDIIVVGGGGAALTAAAEAARLGRRVVVLEKNPRFGGTTAISVGTLMAAGSKMQLKAGIDDSVDRHEAELVEQLQRFPETDNPALRRLLVENSAESADFMASIGVDMIGPLPQPPFPTDRLHVALPGGRAYIARLARHCRRLGVDLRTGTTARSLVVSGDRVTGVAVEHASGLTQTLSAGAVILATGDFSANRQMRSEIVGPELADIAPMNPTATGDGHRMALAVGARLARDPKTSAAAMPQARFAPPPRPGFWGGLPAARPLTWSMKLAMRHLPARLLRPIVLKAAMTFLAPERALYEAGAILVNRAGDRFTDETAPDTVLSLSRQPEASAFIVFDDRIAETFSAWPNFVSTAPGVAYAYLDDYRRTRPDLYHRADSLAALAAELSLPADRLGAAIDQGSGPRPRLVGPPFHALGPLRAWLPLIAIGLAVDDHLRVLGEDDRPIPGLYAAGLVGQGGFMSIYHGHSLGWAFASGRLAGREAAGEIGA